MIDPRDPKYAEKRVEELIDGAVNRACAEVEMPIQTLHRVLLDKAHQLLMAMLELEDADVDGD